MKKIIIFLIIRICTKHVCEVMYNMWNKMNIVEGCIEGKKEKGQVCTSSLRTIDDIGLMR